MTQGSKPGLLRCRQTLYHLSHQARPFKSLSTNKTLFIQTDRGLELALGLQFASPGLDSNFRFSDKFLQEIDV